MNRVETFWSTISFRSQFTISRFELLSEDLRLLITRFAYEESFSEYSKGGGKESNIKLIPFMVQMGTHLLKKSTSAPSSIIRPLKIVLTDRVGDWMASPVSCCLLRSMDCLALILLLLLLLLMLLLLLLLNSTFADQDE